MISSLTSLNLNFIICGLNQCSFFSFFLSFFFFFGSNRSPLWLEEKEMGNKRTPGFFNTEPKNRKFNQASRAKSTRKHKVLRNPDSLSLHLLLTPWAITSVSLYRLAFSAPLCIWHKTKATTPTNWYPVYLSLGQNSWLAQLDPGSMPGPFT